MKYIKCGFQYITLKKQKNVILITNDIKSICFTTPSKFFKEIAERFKAKIQEYSRIANKILNCMPKIHHSMLLNPRLGGAFIDPYIFHAIKSNVTNNPILPGTF